MSLVEAPSRDHGEDDEQSRQWSVESVASTPLDPRTPLAVPSVAPQITAATLARIPQADDGLRLHQDPSRPGDGPDTPTVRAGDDDDDDDAAAVATTHVSALAAFVQQYADIIARDPGPADPQAEMLVGLHVDTKVEVPPAASLANFPADMELHPVPAPSGFADIPVDDDACDASWTFHIEDAYATAYQMNGLGPSHRDFDLEETMRREVAMDDLIFRPNARRARKLVRPDRPAGHEQVVPAAVHKVARKRKRATKESK